MSLIPSMTTRGVRALVPGIPVYQPPRRNAVRVRVKRHGVWHDITHRVHRGVVRHTNDDPVATLDLTLLNGEGFDSLAPRVKDSPLNRGDRPKWSDIAHLRWSDIAHLRWSELPLADRYSPLLDRYNEIMVEAAISTDGSEPIDFVPVFHGLLGDDIRSEHTADAGVVIHLSARDMAKRLQDDVFLEPITYRSMYASQIIQALLNERFGPGEIPLRVIGPDDFWVEEVTFEYIDTWQAIQSFCEQSDKDVRFLLDETDGQIKLTYWTPDTTMTPIWAIDASDIIHETLQTSDDSLRHGVVIRYIDSDGNKQQVQIIDESLRKPKEPLRVALIEEADTSAIRDSASAMRMAQAVFSALRTVPGTDYLRVPFTPHMKIYDVIEVTNPRLRSEPEYYAIEDLQLHFSADEWWTEITASESVKVRHKVWLAKEAKRGIKDPFTPSDWATQTRPPAPVVTLTTGIDEVTQTTAAYVKATWTRPDWRHIDRYTVRIRRVGSDTYQYQETKELSATFHGLISGVEYGVQVAVIDGRGVMGEPSPEVTITTPKDQTIPATPTGLAVTSHIRGVEARIEPNTEPDLRHYIWEYRIGTSGSWQVLARDLVTSRVIPAEAGETVQVRVSAEDWSGNISNPTPAQSAVAGQADKNADIKDGHTLPRLLAWGYASDEELIDLTTGDITPVNPSILVAPKEMLTFSPQQPNAVPNIYTEAIEESSGRFRVKAKTIIKGAFTSWPGGWTSGNDRQGEWRQPQIAGPDGKKGVQTNFIQCRVHWYASAGYVIGVYQDVTNEFNANGDPINWQRVRSFRHQGPLLGAHSGTLNWDVSLENGVWAIRVFWDGGNPPLATYATAEVVSAGYRSDVYLNVDGISVAPNTPSGMSVMFIAYDQG